MGHSASYYWGNVDINTQFFAIIPWSDRGRAICIVLLWRRSRAYAKHDLLSFPGGELYGALGSRKIDGLEWIGPSIDLGMNFHKIAKYYYTGLHESGTMLQFLVNKQAYDSLPKDLQNILKVSMRLASYDNCIDTYHRNGVNLKVMLSEYPGIKIRAFPRDVIRELKAETNKLVEKIILNSDALTKKIVDPIIALQLKD